MTTSSHKKSLMYSCVRVLKNNGNQPDTDSKLLLRCNGLLNSTQTCGCIMTVLGVSITSITAFF